MHTAYHPELTISDEWIVLSQEESNHAVKVLRKSEGERLMVINGKGLMATAEIRLAHHKRCEVSIVERVEREVPHACIHLAIAPTKSMDRMTWLVEKATELGVDRISLIKCANNERSVVKTDKLIKVALAATKQSKRFFLPQIDELRNFKDFIQAFPKGLLAYTDNTLPGDKTSIAEVDVYGPLLIGPEGDFRPIEIELALKSGYQSVTLGPRILRTETAGLYGVIALTQRLEV